MSDEINALFYQTVIADSVFRSTTGGTTADPRLYRRKTPLKLEISETKPAYAVYRMMGTTKLPGSAKISIGQINDRAYSLEVFGKDDADVDTICARLESESVFYEASFLTANYRVGYTWATRGAIDFDDGRQLHLETMTVFFTKIIKLVAT